MFLGEYRRKVQKVRGGGKVRLPKGFFSGPVRKREEEKCLFVIPQGRERMLFLSEEEMRYTEIKDEAVIAGCGSYFEVWSPHRFKEELDRTRETFENELERLINI